MVPYFWGTSIDDTHSNIEKYPSSYSQETKDIAQSRASNVSGHPVSMHSHSIFSAEIPYMSMHITVRKWVVPCSPVRINKQSHLHHQRRFSPASYPAQGGMWQKAHKWVPSSLVSGALSYSKWIAIFKNFLTVQLIFPNNFIWWPLLPLKLLSKVSILMSHCSSESSSE